MVVFCIVTPCGYPPTGPHNFTTQKTLDIFTIVRTSNLIMKRSYLLQRRFSVRMSELTLMKFNENNIRLKVFMVVKVRSSGIQYLTSQVGSYQHFGGI